MFYTKIKGSQMIFFSHRQLQVYLYIFIIYLVIYDDSCEIGTLFLLISTSLSHIFYPLYHNCDVLSHINVVL